MSAIVKNVLDEELVRSLALQKTYEKKLAEYPAGYLLKRKVQDRIYYYLSYREGEKIRQKYLGRMSVDEIKSYEKRIQDKRRIQKQLVEVKANIRYLKRLVKK